MQTVIVRLSAPSGDGKLHGLVEVVGRKTRQPFTDDGELLELLHDAGGTQRLDDHPDGSDAGG